MEKNMGTYFIVGVTQDNVPALFLDLEVPGLDRERHPSMVEARRVVDMLAAEIHLRAIAESVVGSIREVQAQPSPAERVAERMAARMAEGPADEPDEEIVI